MRVDRMPYETSALDALGSHVAKCEPPSDDLRGLLELHVIDTVGALLASTRTAEGLRLLRFRADTSDGAEAASPLALDLAIRCALARLSEIDDIHLSSMTTPGAIVIPGALTLAAAMPTVTPHGVTLHDVLAAMLAGYEAMTRFGRAIDGPAVLYRGIWPTYFAAPFGMSAVAARLFKLDDQASANALALALALASPGVGHHNAESTSRWFAIGAAASNGLAAARAAKGGFTSDRKLMEGNFLSGIYGITPDLSALTDGLGARAALSETSFKPWCAARQTMAATQALREIVQTGVRPQEMDRIEAFVLPPHCKMVDHGVTSGDRASHLTSLQHCMATAALGGDMTADVGQSPPDPPPAVRELMSKIEVAAEQSLLADYPRSWPARVVVTAGSARHERRVMHVPGDPARPFDRAQVREKFTRFVAPALGKEKTAKMLAHIDDALARGSFAALAAEIEKVCSDALVRCA